MVNIKEHYVQAIIDKAKSLGFDDCGFASAEELSTDKERLRKWLDDGMHGDMHYMANHFSKRTNPSFLVEGAKTVIVLLTNYFPKEKPQNKEAYRFARYAYGQDYHRVLKDKLKILFAYIKENIYPELEGRLFVDSAPVLERSLAQKAGLGWIGKNTNLIHKRLGSYIFISELIINLELPIGEPIKNACGGCSRCLDACPTGALVEPGVLDARKCISYLTIENRDIIPDEFVGRFQNWIYGCDICQEACPWTWKSRPNSTPEFQMQKNFIDFTEDYWKNITISEFNEMFRKSAVKRTKFEGLTRNIDFVYKKKK